MKLFFLLLLAGLCAGQTYTRVFAEQNQAGYYYDFFDYVPDMSAYGFDNDADSVVQTGMWMYYDNYDYNVQAGKVYWVHGIDIYVNFPFDYSNMCSSMRFVGSPNYINDDTYTVYDGAAFTGREFYGNYDSDNLGSVGVSSIIVTGLSPWTFFTGVSWTGASYCIYPDTDHDVGADGSYFDLGIYPDIYSIGMPDNGIYSVAKGCFSDTVIKAPKLKADGRQKNGAWGQITL